MVRNDPELLSIMRSDEHPACSPDDFFGNLHGSITHQKKEYILGWIENLSVLANRTVKIGHFAIDSECQRLSKRDSKPGLGTIFAIATFKKLNALVGCTKIYFDETSYPHPDWDRDHDREKNALRRSMYDKFYLHIGATPVGSNCQYMWEYNNAIAYCKNNNLTALL